MLWSVMKIPTDARNYNYVSSVCYHAHTDNELTNGANGLQTSICTG